MAREKASLIEIKNTSNTLATLAREASEISRLLLESEGELSPELEARLDVNAKNLVQKLDGYNYILDELDGQVARWKRRRDACSGIAKRFESQIERMRERIKLAMKEMGKPEIAGSYCKFQVRNSRPKLVIDDEAKIPESYKMVVTTTVVDKERVTSALKDGFTVQGAHLEENGALYITEAAQE